MTKQKDSFIVYRSFYEAAEPLSDQEELQLYRAIFNFGLNHKQTEMEPLPRAMFQLIKPQLEANHKRWINGNKGGRPIQKESEDKPSDNQNESTAEPNKNKNKNKNKNANKNNNANVVITLPLNDSSGYDILDSDLDKYKDLYPAVDVDQQLRSMLGWLDSNPKRRKTKNGIANFVNTWLSKEQDNPRAKPAATVGRIKPGAQRLKELA